MRKIQSLEGHFFSWVRGGVLFALAGLTSLHAASTESGERPAISWAMADEIVASIQAPRIPKRDFLITAYGAASTDGFDSLPAVRAALRDAAQAGGGRIVVPPGRWFIKGPIHLQSHIELHVQKGAELVFSAEPADYLPVVLTRWEGSVCFNYSPFIYAFQATDVALTGEGVINGNAATGFGEWRPHEKPAQLRLRQMGNDLVPVHERVFGEGSFLRPPFIQFFGCERVLVEDVTIKDSPFWCIHPVFCSDVTVRGVTVDSHRMNNDGVDPDSSSNVLIENCVFKTGDDAVAIKSGRDQDGWRIGRPTERVVIRNCDMPAVHNALAVGSEMSGGVQSIFMENCRIGSARSCIYFKSNPDRGGYIRGVRVRNIQVGVSRAVLVDLWTDYPGWRGNSFPSHYEDFVIENIECDRAEKFGVYAVGKSEAPISNILLRDVTIRSAEIPQYLALVEGLRFEGVTINGEAAEPRIKPAESLGTPEEERAIRHVPLQATH